MQKNLIAGAAFTLTLLAGGCALWGWQPLPVSVPSQSKLYQSSFAKASEQAMAALQQSRQQQDMPALTAAVAWRGELLWAGAAGYADLALGQPATVASPFRIGSTSKAVTATAVARAVAAGKLTLDDPIKRWMHDVPNPAWQHLTLRQLLSHTAGFPGYAENSDFSGKMVSWLKHKEFKDVQSSLSIFDEADLLYPPGTKFHYSSFDVNLASAVLEAATGQPFLDYLQQQISTPLGLTSLSGANFLTPAQMQFYHSKEGKVKLHGAVDLSQKWAGGGLAASSVDLVRIGSAWFNPEFLPAAQREQFWTIQRLNNGEQNKDFYALGWRHYQQPHLYCDKQHPLSKNISFVNHGGVSDGAQSWLVIYPELELVVALNTNTVKDNFCDFAGQAAAITRPFIQQIAPHWLR